MTTCWHPPARKPKRSPGSHRSGIFHSYMSCLYILRIYHSLFTYIKCHRKFRISMYPSHPTTDRWQTICILSHIWISTLLYSAPLKQTYVIFIFTLKCTWWVSQYTQYSFRIHSVSRRFCATYNSISYHPGKEVAFSNFPHSAAIVICGFICFVIWHILDNKQCRV